MCVGALPVVGDEGMLTTGADIIGLVGLTGVVGVE